MGNEYTPPLDPLELFTSAVRMPSPFIHVTNVPLVFEVGAFGYSLATGVDSSYTSKFDMALMPIAVFALQGIATTGDVMADLVFEGGAVVSALVEEKRWSLAAGSAFWVYTCKFRYYRFKVKNWGPNTLTITQVKWYQRSTLDGV